MSGSSCWSQPLRAAGAGLPLARIRTGRRRSPLLIETKLAISIRPARLLSADGDRLAEIWGVIEPIQHRTSPSPAVWHFTGTPGVPWKEWDEGVSGRCRRACCIRLLWICIASRPVQRLKGNLARRDEKAWCELGVNLLPRGQGTGSATQFSGRAVLYFLCISPVGKLGSWGLRSPHSTPPGRPNSSPVVPSSLPNSLSPTLVSHLPS